jgi:hypothetical protein
MTQGKKRVQFSNTDGASAPKRKRYEDDEDEADGGF